MGIFSGIGEAKTFGSGTYFAPGLYEVEITRVVRGTKRNTNVAYVVVECAVLWSNREDCPVGSTRSWYVGFDKDAALGNIKAFLATAVNEELDDVTEALAEEAFDSEKTELVGVKLDAEAYPKETKAGDTITLLAWKPYKSIRKNM